MAPVTVRPLVDSAGTRIHLGKKIGSGGEGDVYDIIPPQNVVAKIYHKPLDAEKQEKLRLMARGCNEELQSISAWPTDVLSAKEGGPVVGFLMPKISEYEPVHKVYGPTHRKEVFPHADWRFLVRTAKNLAAAFFVIHKFGYVVGDVNEGNILVNDTACVRLIDCDSFQVRAGARLWCCEVGVAQFTPPEIHISKNFGMERTANHDDFGLAVLIFQLLFFGRHRYSGVYAGKDDMPIERAITEFRFAYGKHAHLKSIAPPPNSVGLSVVPTQVAGLFEQAFAETGARPAGRPTAGDWWDALESLETRMRKCSEDSVHSYYSRLAACPWCRLEESSGLLLFLSADRIAKIDLRREWPKVEAIVPPGQLPRIDPANFPHNPAPLSPAVSRSLGFRKIRQLAGLGFIAGLILMAIGEMITDYLLFLPFGIAIAALILYPGAAADEKKRRRLNLENARYMWTTPNSWLGYQVAVDGTHVLIGAENKNSLTGAAYMFEATSGVVLNRPDLAGVVGWSNMPTTVQAGDVYLYRVDVTNTGDAMALGLMNIQVWLSTDGDLTNPATSFLFGTGTSFAVVSAGQTGSYYVVGFVPSGLTAGPWHTVVVVDSAHQIAETSVGELNNQATGSSTVAYALPDLTVSFAGFYLPSSSPLAGSWGYALVQVTNSGPGRVWGSSDISLTAIPGTGDAGPLGGGGQLNLTTQHVAMYLGTGQSGWYFIPFTLPGTMSGSCSIWAAADCLLCVPETNELNNTVGTGTYIVQQPYVDLAGAVSLAINPLILQNPTRTNSYNLVELRVLNQGSVAAAGFATMQLWASADGALGVGSNDYKLAEIRPYVYIPAGGTGYFYFSYLVPAGIPNATYHLMAVIDSGSDISETGGGAESNNTINITGGFVISTPTGGVAVPVQADPVGGVQSAAAAIVGGAEAAPVVAPVAPALGDSVTFTTAPVSASATPAPEMVMEGAGTNPAPSMAVGSGYAAERRGIALVDSQWPDLFPLGSSG